MSRANDPAQALVLRALITAGQTRRPAWSFALLLAGVAALGGACGGNASFPALLGGESHFLRRCSATCGDGLDCISGLCTRGCVVNNEAACMDLGAATCTAASIEPGAVAVCDLACDSDASCSGLGTDYRCEGGFCRGQELVASGLNNAGAGGTDGTGGADSSALPENTAGTTSDLECANYRNQPGETELLVVIRNERTEPLYVQPFTICKPDSTSWVSFERDGQSVNVIGHASCALFSCEGIQDNGPPPQARDCVDDCGVEPRLLRLEPGGEFSAGSRWREFFEHLPPTDHMPGACSDASAVEEGYACSKELPLPAAEYVIAARAFQALECAVDASEPCDCAPDASNTCVTFRTRGAGAQLRATATVQVPAGTTVLTFRND